MTRCTSARLTTPRAFGATSPTSSTGRRRCSSRLSALVLLLSLDVCDACCMPHVRVHGLRQLAWRKMRWLLPMASGVAEEVTGPCSGNPGTSSTTSTCAKARSSPPGSRARPPTCALAVAHAHPKTLRWFALLVAPLHAIMPCLRGLITRKLAPSCFLTLRPDSGAALPAAAATTAWTRTSPRGAATRPASCGRAMSPARTRA